MHACDTHTGTRPLSLHDAMIAVLVDGPSTLDLGVTRQHSGLMPLTAQANNNHWSSGRPPPPVANVAASCRWDPIHLENPGSRWVIGKGGQDKELKREVDEWQTGVP